MPMKQTIQHNPPSPNRSGHPEGLHVVIPPSHGNVSPLVSRLILQPNLLGSLATG